MTATASGWSGVERAHDVPHATVEDVLIDLGRLDVAVAEKLLDGPDVGPALQQVRRNAVPEGVGCHPADNARGLAGLPDPALDAAGAPVV